MQLFDATDQPREVLDKARQYARDGRAELLSADDPLVAGKLRLVGLYDDRQSGYFMLRTRIPGGRLSWEQAAAIAGVAAEFTTRPPEYENGPERFLEITTRQGIQLHWIRPADLPEIWRRYEDVGLLTLSACGDGARNITSCPIAGIDRNEAFDASSAVRDLNRYLVETPDYGAGLPRKFKTALTGCREDCILAGINDLAFTPAERDGEHGFNVRVGGGLSDYPRLASPLDGFVRPDQVIPMTCAAIDVFKRFGDYETKAVNRFRRVVEDLGIERVRAEISARLPFSLAGAGTAPASMPRFDHVGVHPQREPGRVYLGLGVPAGRMSGTDFAEIARVARDYGDGTVRATPRQNLVLSGVDARRVEEALEEPILQNYSPSPSPAQRSVVACTSAPFCKYGILDAKSHALSLATRLDDILDADGSLRIHMSGCKASCAQAQIGDIGLRAALQKDEDGYREAFDVALGGNLAEGRLARWVALEVPVEGAFEGIRRLAQTYRDERRDGEPFSAYLSRISPDRAAAVFQEVAR